LGGVSKQIEFLNEDGTLQTWTWDVDIEKVKTDLQKDIDSSYEAIELLIHRKTLLEEKLIELNHTELVKK